MSNQKKLDQNHFKIGFEITIRNALSPMEDSAKLAETKSYGSAVALLVLSAEEGMKAYTVLTQHFYPEKKNRWL